MGLPIARKKLIEVSRNRFFFIFTFFFCSLFPILLVVLYKIQSSTGGFPLLLDPLSDLRSSTGGPYRLAVVGASVAPSFLQAAQSGLGQVSIDFFNETSALSAAVLGETKAGFPWPFRFGFDVSSADGPSIILRNTLQNGTASVADDLSSYLTGVVLASGTNVSFQLRTLVPCSFLSFLRIFSSSDMPRL